MNTKSIKSTGAFAVVAAISVLAAFASTAVRADEADGSQHALQFQGSRTRAEVMAEAATVPSTRSTEPAGSRVAPLTKSALDRATVRDDAKQASRAGLTNQGEAGHI
jgi:hypothetical protein